MTFQKISRLIKIKYFTKSTKVKKIIENLSVQVQTPVQKSNSENVFSTSTIIISFGPIQWNVGVSTLTPIILLQPAAVLANSFASINWRLVPIGSVSPADFRPKWRREKDKDWSDSKSPAEVGRSLPYGQLKRKVIWKNFASFNQIQNKNQFRVINQDQPNKWTANFASKISINKIQFNSTIFYIYSITIIT